MTTESATYLVDERGRKKAIVLNMKEYARLLQHIEELEDALHLEEAVREASGARDYRQIREELQREGRL